MLFSDERSSSRAVWSHQYSASRGRGSLDSGHVVTHAVALYFAVWVLPSPWLWEERAGGTRLSLKLSGRQWASAGKLMAESVSVQA